jgi:hypothetical protein
LWNNLGQIAYDAPEQPSSTSEHRVENSPPTFDSNSSPNRSESRPTPGAWISIFLAGVIGLALTTGLFVLMLQFGGPLAVVAVLVFGLGGVIALFHYLVWGWWLGRTIREEVAAEERQRLDE